MQYNIPTIMDNSMLFKVRDSNFQAIISKDKKLSNTE